MNIKSKKKYLLALLIPLFFISCTKKNIEPVSDSKMLLGTSCFITVYDIKKGSDPHSALKKGFDVIREMEQRLSVSIEGSEIATLNEKKSEEISNDSLLVLKEALDIAKLSKGRFDPSIGALVSLWGIGTDKQRVPAEQEIQKALKTVNYRNIEINKNLVTLKNKGMMIDLGGIAKGHASDLVKKTLMEEGVTSAIINLGGNIELIGNKPDSTPWKIGIQNPEDQRGQYVGILETEDTAVVTSGIYERYFVENNIHYHHILDTETGYPVNNGLQSLTVVTHSGLLADGLSTALFSMGTAKAMEYAESNKKIDIIIIDNQNKVYVSSGIKDSFTITNNEDFTYSQ